MREFDAIREYFAPLARNSSWLAAGIGEDCALLDGSAFGDMQLASSIDTLVEGVHFPRTLPASLAANLARRALGSAFSDLAACAAEPLGFSVALSLPSLERKWLRAFAQGLAECMDSWSVELLGGDLTAGALTVTVHVIGRVPAGKSLRRDGARCGDDLYLSGCTGEAAAALRLIEEALPIEDVACETVMSRYWSPKPRIELAIQLRDIATAAIDVSDGLLADAAHIAEMSGCRLSVEHDKLPLSTALCELAGDEAIQLALSGGDDYELLFTAPPEARDAVMRLGRSCKLDCTRIGKVLDGAGVACDIEVAKTGWQHFAT